MSEEMKTIVMETIGGKKRRVVVPAKCKVTFGAVCPGSSGQKDGSGYSGRYGWCLRVYETKDRYLAVFTDVVSFREESVKVQERITRSKAKRVHDAGPDGRQEAVVEARVTEWVDPDDPDGGDSTNKYAKLLAEGKPSDEEPF